MTVQLKLEKNNGKLWGRILYDDNLIVDSATTLQVLEKQLRKVLKDFHKVDNAKFEYAAA